MLRSTTIVVAAIVLTVWAVVNPSGSTRRDLTNTVDEAVTLPDLANVRDAALAAVRARDVSSLAALTHPEDTLRERVMRQHQSFDAFWGPALKALTNGGRFVEVRTDRQFCAPWAARAIARFIDFTDLVPDDLLGPEGLLPVIVLAPTAVFNQEPGNVNAHPIATASSGYLKALEEVTEWTDPIPVEFRGTRAWVPRDAIWSVWERPVCFALLNNVWRLVGGGGIR